MKINANTLRICIEALDIAINEEKKYLTEKRFVDTKSVLIKKIKLMEITLDENH